MYFLYQGYYYLAEALRCHDSKDIAVKYYIKCLEHLEEEGNESLVCDIVTDTLKLLKIPYGI